MLGGKNRHALGYTITEVMIVLAVSGMMFLIAANFINGKQQRTAFTEGINDMASRLQDTIEQVRSGKYSDADLSCTFNPNSGVLNFGGSPAGQGTNPGCVFLGKLVYFSYDPSNPNSSYEIFTVAGGRLDTNGNPFTSPIAAHATVIDAPDLTARKTTPQNLTIHRVTVNGGTSSFGIGFFQSPAVNAAGNLSNGGAERVDIYYVPSLGAGQGEGHAATLIKAGSLAQTDTADICLTDGTRFGEIILGINPHTGNSGNPLTVAVIMDGTTPC